jgi:hypothetical protein
MIDDSRMVAFSFMFAPLISEPPSYALPDPSDGAQWYGEVWLKYPLAQSLAPSYFGHVLRARSQFRIIMNDYCQTAYSKGSTVALEKANEFHLRLKDWHDALPEPLTPKRIVLPGHLHLQ